MLIAALHLSSAFVPSAWAQQSPSVREAFEALREPQLLAQRRQTCGDMRSCREAVILWCDGYTRADGDGDGIPCETVCSTLAEVNEIRAEIGC